MYNWRDGFYFWKSIYYLYGRDRLTSSSGSGWLRVSIRLLPSIIIEVSETSLFSL